MSDSTLAQPGSLSKLIDWIRKEMIDQPEAADGVDATEAPHGLCGEAGRLLLLPASPGAGPGLGVDTPSRDSGYLSLRRHMGVLERLQQTQAVWLQPGLGRQDALRSLQDQPPGAFLVRRSSRRQAMVICLRMERDSPVPLREFPITESQCTMFLEGSSLNFTDLFRLVAFCCISRDVLPFVLQLPEATTLAQSAADLQEIAKLGAGFWDSELCRGSKNSSPCWLSRGTTTPPPPVSVETGQLRTRAPSQLDCCLTGGALCFLNPLFLLQQSAAPTGCSPAPSGRSPAPPGCAHSLTGRRPPRSRHHSMPEKASWVFQKEKSVSMVSQEEKRVSMVSQEEKSISIVSQEEKSISIVSQPEESISRVSQEEKSISIVSQPEESISRVSQEEKSISIASQEAKSISIVSQEEKSISIVSQPEESISRVSQPEESISRVSQEEKSISIVSQPEESISRASQEEKSISIVSQPEESISRVSQPEESISTASQKKPSVPWFPPNPFPDKRQSASVSIPGPHETRPRFPSSPSLHLERALERAQLMRQNAVAGRDPPLLAGEEEGEEEEEGRGSQRLSDISTSSSDSLETPSGDAVFSMSPASGEREQHPLSMSLESDIFSDLEQEDQEEQKEVPVDFQRRRASAGAQVLQKAFRGLPRKMSNAFSSLLTPEKRAWRRVLELSRQRASYVGCLVQDFLCYVAEETAAAAAAAHGNGSELLQTVRQFITQMKNYLRQCNELEMESLSEEHADQVLEKALHKCVLKPLKGVLDIALRGHQERSGALQELQGGLSRARGRSLQEMGVSGPPPDPIVVEKVRLKILTMCKMYSPERKVGALLQVCKLVYGIMGNPSGGADDFLPMLTYMLAQCDMPELDNQILYMMELLDPSQLNGEGGYYLTSAYGAMSLIRAPQEEQGAHKLSSKTQNTLRQWHRRRTMQRPAPSVDDFQNYLRVALQTEDSGCTAKTLQVRPHTTTEEVCQLCALKFQVEASDHTLFLLTEAGSERLAPDTHPQRIKAELHSRQQPAPFHFVFRRVAEGVAHGDHREVFRLLSEDVAHGDDRQILRLLSEDDDNGDDLHHHVASTPTTNLNLLPGPVPLSSSPLPV